MSNELRFISREATIIKPAYEAVKPRMRNLGIRHFAGRGAGLPLHGCGEA